MDFNFIFDYLISLAPWVSLVFIALGSLVVIGTAVDAAIPDEKDGGFMTKLLAIPVIGPLLNALKRFSPFNAKPKE